MRKFLLLLLAGSLDAGSLEGTVWYDSRGAVAWVDGPAAAAGKRPSFVPQWVAREERRDRALRGGYHPRGRWSDGRAIRGYGGGSFHRPGGHVWGGIPRCPFQLSSFSPQRHCGGLRLIIR